MGTTQSWLHRLLFATDFSPGASRAQEYALFLARTYGAELLVLHVWERYPTLAADAYADPFLLEPVRAEVAGFLDELTERLKQAGARAASAHAIGIASEEILKHAQEQAVELIVVGTQGRTGLEHVLLGSTAERVVKGAPCPVLTVRSVSPRTVSHAPTPFRRMVVPLDFSDCSLDALEFAIQVARGFESSMTLLHVLEWAWLRLHFTIAELAEGESPRREFESCLARYAEVIRAEGLAADTMIHGGGAPADFIVETAHRTKADLIVMGTHGRRGLSRTLMGSVAEGVLRRASCPVLTVKSPKFAAGHQRVLAQPTEASAPPPGTGAA